MNTTLCSFPGCMRPALAAPHANRRLCAACVQRIQEQNLRSQERRERYAKEARAATRRARAQRKARAKKAREADSVEQQEAARKRAVDVLRRPPVAPARTAHTPPGPLRERAPGWWEVNDR